MQIKYSFRVGSEDNTSAVNGLITESERSPVIEAWIPQTFRSNSQSLSLHFSVKYLNSNLISRHFQLFDSGSDDPCQILCHIGAFGRIKGCPLQLFVKDGLNNIFDTTWEKSLVLFRLELECISTLSHCSFNIKLNIKFKNN